MMAPKRYVHVWTPGTCKRDLTWKKRPLQIKELKMLSPWIIQVGLKSNSKCPKIQKRRQTEKAGHMKADAEIEFIQLQAKGHPELPEAGKGKEGFSSRWSLVLPASWFLNSGFQKCGRINFHCFKPPSLWLFVITS